VNAIASVTKQSKSATRLRHLYHVHVGPINPKPCIHPLQPVTEKIIVNRT